MHHIYLVQNH